MARHGTVTPGVQKLLTAARKQWGADAVEEYRSGLYRVRPPDKTKPQIVVSGKGNARGEQNARAMLRNAGLTL